MRIAIAGAGAMGSRFGLMLHQAGNDVLLIDGWEEHINQIKQHGLQANFNGTDMNVDLPIVSQTNLEQQPPVQLVIVFTKAIQLEGMLQDIKSLLTNDTKVVVLLNGIGHEDIIKQYLPLENIFIGNTMWTAELVGPGQIKLLGSGSVVLQNIAPGQEETAHKLAEILSEAGLNARYSDNIRYEIYKKATVNASLNTLSTILEANITTVGNTHTALDIIQNLIGEFVAVAAAESIVLDLDELVANIEKTFDPAGIGLHFPSMYQDLIQNHRYTEVDYINGAISRKGQAYGIPTPYNDLLTALVHAKEDILIKGI